MWLTIRMDMQQRVEEMFIISNLDSPKYPTIQMNESKSSFT